MCCPGDTVEMPIRQRVVSIDRCIHHIVAALNAANIETLASCCGHGKRAGIITLADGRELVVHPDRTLDPRYDPTVALPRDYAAVAK